MEAELRNLEHCYDLFIDREQPPAFFQGLSEYLDYLYGTASFKSIFDTYMAERAGRYAEIATLETTALAEMQEAKAKILQVIQKKKIDVSTFERMSIMRLADDKTILEEMELYEQGLISKDGYRSDQINRYLFEISANLKKLGYGSDVKDFLATPRQYADYYERVNGRSDAYSVFGNEHGNFVFSKTWPDRFQADALMERERKMKPWGSFEALFRFKNAYDAATQNTDFMSLLNYVPKSRLDSDDSVATAFMVEDVQILIGDGADTIRRRFSNTPDKMRDLHRDVFKVHAQTVHGRILREINSKTVLSSESGSEFDAEKSRLHVRDKTISIRKFSDQYHALRVMFENPKETSKEWFFSEIAERVDKLNPNDKRYYNAIYQVGLKLKTAGFSDYFVTTRQSARIAQKYLS